ncbi:hypothetical protein ACJX0J_023979, partial [Zea mays]
MKNHMDESHPWTIFMFKHIAGFMYKGTINNKESSSLLAMGLFQLLGGIALVTLRGGQENNKEHVCLQSGIEDSHIWRFPQMREGVVLRSYHRLLKLAALVVDSTKICYLPDSLSGANAHLTIFLAITFYFNRNIRGNHCGIWKQYIPIHIFQGSVLTFQITIEFSSLETTGVNY